MLESRNGRCWPQLTEYTLTPSTRGMKAGRATKHSKISKVKGLGQGQRDATGPATPYWCPLGDGQCSAQPSKGRDGKIQPNPTLGQCGACTGPVPRAAQLCASEQHKGTPTPFSAPHPPCKWISCKQRVVNYLEASHFLAHADSCWHCCTKTRHSLFQLLGQDLPCSTPVLHWADSMLGASKQGGWASHR